MPNFGSSEIFLTIFPKMTGINLEWSNMANDFSQNGRKKFGMAKNGCSKCFLTIFPKKLMSWPENQGILFFLYFSNIANEPDIFHGFPP